MNVIVDCDALLGLYYPQDKHHSEALKIAKKIEQMGANVLILPTTLAEFALLASSRIGREGAQKAVSHLTGEGFFLLDVTTETTNEAVQLYEEQTSKEESLFDCFVMVAARQLRADYVFSFDKGYAKNGFSLLED